MYTRPVVLIFLLFFFIPYLLNGQGCSDAGFCTIHSFKPSESAGSKIKQYPNQLKTGISFGRADNSISIVANYVEYNRQINNDYSIDARLTSLSQGGNNISVFGISDLYLTGNYSFSDRVKFTLGTKIPFNKANRTKNGLPLPMDYQSSLGTFDLITGFGFHFKKLQIVLAMQQPLTQNENKFLPGDYPVNSKLRNFAATNNFKRAGDILLRLSYPFPVGQKVTVTPGILPIYHLANDRFTNSSGVELSITGSKGLTVNTNIFVDYYLSKRDVFQLSFGAPSVTRDARPDGLTRSYVVGLEFRRKF